MEPKNMLEEQVWSLAGGGEFGKMSKVNYFKLSVYDGEDSSITIEWENTSTIYPNVEEEESRRMLTWWIVKKCQEESRSVL